MPQDRLTHFLKYIYRNATTVLLVLGFLIVVCVGIIFWFSGSNTNGKPGVSPTPNLTEPTTTLESDAVPTPPSSPSSTQEASTPDLYTVQPGDSLWSIAEQELGSGARFVELADYNKLAHAAWLEVGQELQLPDARINQDSVQRVEEVQRDQISYGAESYTVVRGDSLWEIAATQLGDPYRWPELYAENKQVIGSNPDLIYPDTELVVPAKLAEQ